MSVDDLLALPDDEWHYELVEGRLVRMPPSGVPASRLAMRLGARLTTYVEDHNLGIVTGTDGGFTLSKGTTLAPDIAFVRADRVLPPTSPDYDKPWPLAPDLVVEIASPNQSRPKMAAKATRYLQAGVRLVWVGLAQKTRGRRVATRRHTALHHTTHRGRARGPGRRARLFLRPGRTVQVDRQL